MKKPWIAALLAASLIAAGASSALATEPSLDQLLETMQKDAEQNQTEVIMESSDFPSASSHDDDYSVKDGEVVTTEEEELAAEAETMAQADGDLEKAYLKLIQRYAVDTQNPDALIRLAIAYSQNGNYGQAVSALKKAIRLDPKNKKIQHLLAEKLHRSGNPGFQVYVQGSEIAFDVKPQLVNGRTLIPVRKVTEALGANVSYQDGVVIIELNGKKIRLVIDSSDAQVDGAAVKLDVPASIVEGRTLVPLRFISENLEKTVDYAAIGEAKVICVSNN